MDPRAQSSRLVSLVALAAGVALIVLSLKERGDLFVGIVGMLLLGVAGALVERSHRPVVAGAILSIPGAVVLTLPVQDATWERALTAAVIVFAGGAAPALDRHWHRTPAVPLFAVGAVAGVALCAPETAHVTWLIAAMVVLAVPGLLAHRPYPAPVALPVTGVLAWAALSGAALGESAVVGGLASLGLLVIWPVVAQLPGPGEAVVPVHPWFSAALLQLFAGIVVGLTAGRAASLTSAVVISAVMLAVLAITTRLAGGRVV